MDYKLKSHNLSIIIMLKITGTKCELNFHISHLNLLSRTLIKWKIILYFKILSSWNNLLKANLNEICTIICWLQLKIFIFDMQVQFLLFHNNPGGNLFIYHFRECNCAVIVESNFQFISSNLNSPFFISTHVNYSWISLHVNNIVILTIKFFITLKAFHFLIWINELCGWFAGCWE